MQSEVIVYALPFLEERPMTKGDVAAAIAWFKEKTGNEARLITLNPKSEKFAKEAPDGVTVNYVGGCLAWEIWLSAEMKEFAIGGAASAATEDRPTNIPDTGEKQASTGAPALTQPAARELHQPAILSHPRRGRTPKKLPLQKVRRLAAEGLGSRKIAERLQGEGIDASYRTVARVLKNGRVCNADMMRNKREQIVA